MYSNPSPAGFVVVLKITLVVKPLSVNPAENKPQFFRAFSINFQLVKFELAIQSKLFKIWLDVILSNESLWPGCWNASAAR